MKYGVIIYKYEFLETCDEGDFNIGDYIQSYSVLELYKSIGIPQSDIVYVSLEELADYSGPYMVVIFNMYGGFFGGEISSHIIPVFWGFSYAGYIEKSLYWVLKTNEPIGCRDITTLNNMRSRGISSFLSGCLTMTLPYEKSENKDGKYVFVDTPKELNAFIPSEILDRIEKKSHIIKHRIPLSEEYARRQIDRARDVLLKYKKEAAVIVTGRLHCASPCIAMGIPVIIVKKNRDTNMGWIEKFSSIYTPDVFDKIDWYPASQNNERIKAKMIEGIASHIRFAGRFKTQYDLSFELEESVEKEFNLVLYNKLDDIVKRIGTNKFRFAIWGLGEGGAIAYRLIKEVYPNSDCRICVDGMKEGEFFEMRIQKPSDLESCIEELDYVFLTTYSGRKEAVRFLNEHGLKRGINYSFLISRVNGEDEFYSL